jgi:hypothetical protein
MLARTFLKATSGKRRRTMAGVMELISKIFRGKRQGESSMTNRKIRFDNVNRPPRTQAERIAAAMLTDNQQIHLSELAEQLAERLYRDELRHGGWAVDFGLLGPNVFVADALRLLRAGDRDLWKIIASDEDQ